MMKSKKGGDKVIVYLSGEIDHCSAEKLRYEIEALIADCKIRKLILDFCAVSFMDSSGIGMLIGRYKTMHLRGGTMAVCALQPQVGQLFRMAGLHRIIAQEDTEGQAK